MTSREEEIYKQSDIFSDENACYGTWLETNFGFRQGAMWTDNNPRLLYIVMRCEEHSDYVEKVFVDKDKAIAYCDQYNSNPREYSRTIEEMEVTL